MSSEPTQPPKLSLVAELDDMFRFQNSFIAEDDEKGLNELIVIFLIVFIF
jgi:hypothetical protein